MEPIKNVSSSLELAPLNLRPAFRCFFLGEVMEQDPKRELLNYIDQELHRSVMAAQPNRSSGDHRRRLNDLQIVRRREIELLQRCVSAQDVATTFLTRAESGALDEGNHDAQDLGLPTILEMLDAIRLKARALGLHCDDRRVVAFSSAQMTHAKRLHEPAEHAPGDLKDGDDLIVRQSALLDEGVEESFPASDSVSVHRIV